MTLFSTGSEMRHLHSLVTRIAVVGAAVSALVLVSIGLVTGESRFFGEALGPFLVVLALLVMVATGREHAAVVFGLATASVVVAHRVVGTPATTVAATTAIVVMGCLGVLFVDKHVLPYIAGGVVLNLLAPMYWAGQLQGGLSTGLVMALSFLIGSLAFLLVRNAASQVNARYRSIFEQAPVALVEFNWDDVVPLIEALAPSDADDLRVALVEDPGLVRSVVARVEVARANEAAARLLGAASPGELLGDVDPRFLHGQFHDVWIEQIVAAWFGQSEHEHEAHVEMGGHERWLTFKAFTGTDANQSLVAMSDVTPSRLLEQSLTEVIQAKDEFIASVSHELRTPLTAVVGLASELMSSNLADDRERAELLELLAGQSVEMAHIVEDLLVAARAETGTITVALDEVDLATEARDLASQLDPTVHLSMDTDRAIVAADRVRVRQIIRNLLVNAGRYGGKRRRLVVARSESSVVVEMRDSGVPLEDDERDRIFLPYERAHEQAGVTAAVGLGLSVSQRLAELMGGSLEYDHDGETVFRLTLPAVVAPESVPSRGAASAAS